jgi:hypothetical protein
VAGGPLGGGIDSSEDMSEPATDTSLSPSSCGMSAIAGGSPAGSFSGCRCHLCFAGETGRDGLVTMPAPLRSAPAADSLAAACIRRAAAEAAFVFVAAAFCWQSFPGTHVLAVLFCYFFS